MMRDGLGVVAELEKDKILYPCLILGVEAEQHSGEDRHRVKSGGRLIPAEMPPERNRVFPFLLHTCWQRLHHS
jgi:hypothetical protein